MISPFERDFVVYETIMFHGNENTVYTFFNKTYVVSDPGLISTFFVFGKHKDVGDFSRDYPFAPQKEDLFDDLAVALFGGDEDNIDNN